MATKSLEDYFSLVDKHNHSFNEYSARVYRLLTLASFHSDPENVIKEAIVPTELEYDNFILVIL